MIKGDGNENVVGLGQPIFICGEKAFSRCFAKTEKEFYFTVVSVGDKNMNI